MRKYSVYEFKVPKEKFEAVEELLFSLDCMGTEILSENGEIHFKAYFEKDKEFPADLNLFIIGKTSLEEKNWLEEWKKYFKPTRVSEKIWVVPSWQKESFQVPEGSIPIYIYPGQTFGTGTHETTKLVMRFMEKAVKGKDSILDVGCGSGILSILAKKLGVKTVVGCDIQKESLDEVAFNSKLNGVDGIKVIIGSVDDVEGSFDVVVANIEKHLLEPLIPKISEKAKDLVILSGILKKQREEFLKTLERNNLRVFLEAGEGEWIAFCCKK